MPLVTAPAIPATGALRVTPWPDPVIDQLGFDPRSTYVEAYWLSTLGPSTTWLLRRLAHGLDSSPEGFELDLPECAREIGLGDKGGRHSPFARSLARLVQFEIARWQPSDGTLEVRRRVPPLNRRQVMHLPETLRVRHDEWQTRQLESPAPELIRKRCRSLAYVLLDTGVEREEAERQLLQWGFHPALSYESATWATERLSNTLSR
ncbi:MAG TPA: hypothetical protein VMZ22_10140 [Acidimicrobiales bacterium]|nr:hypothetical protein [Acidimicrobiales bacterium]